MVVPEIDECYDTCAAGYETMAGDVMQSGAENEFDGQTWEMLLFLKMVMKL